MQSTPATAFGTDDMTSITDTRDAFMRSSNSDGRKGFKSDKVDTEDLDEVDEVDDERTRRAHSSWMGAIFHHGDLDDVGAQTRLRASESA